MANQKLITKPPASDTTDPRERFSELAEKVLSVSKADIDASVARVLASPEPGVDAMFTHVVPPFGGPSSGGRRDDREEVRP